MKSFKQFQEAALAIPAAAGVISKVLPAAAATIGAAGTIMQIKNNQGPGIKDGSSTKKGGVWDNLPKGRSGNKNLTGIAKEVMRKRNKDILKKYIKDKYGNKDKLTGGTLPEEMMGAGAIANNVGDGKIAGTVEAGDDPPVKKKKKSKKKKRYVYGGKGSRKMWLT